jgi:hypothetical protein
MRKTMTYETVIEALVWYSMAAAFATILVIVVGSRHGE